MLILSFIASFLALASSSLAHNIQLKAHSRECFHETLHSDDKMTVTFQVGDREFGGSGNLEIDFWVRRNILSADASMESLTI
jgi:p24 family protein beta-1